MVANTYYLEIDVYFIEYPLAVEIDEKKHADRDLIFEEKTRSTRKKNLVVKLLESILAKTIMIQIMKLVEYKHSLVSLKTGNQKNQKKNQTKKIKKLEHEIKKIKTSIKQILKKNYRPYKKWWCMINIMLKTKKPSVRENGKKYLLLSL